MAASLSRVPENPSTTVVFCVESGHFEAQTLLAIECLRKFGGRFANVPVLAITPRLGPSLTPETRQRFDELNVTYVKQDMHHRYSWFGFMNKGLAVMLAADLYASTEQIIWLDSDTLVAAEPEGLWLDPDIDFAVCSTSKNVGTSGPGDKNEPYWLALSKFYGVDIDRFPWITTEFDHARVRFRVHSGVFSFRRASGLGKEYLKACEKMLDSRIAYTQQLPFPGDSVALSFAVVALNLRWQLLPLSYNFSLTPKSLSYTSSGLHTAKVLHYHEAMTTADTCAWAMNEIKSQLPDLYHWLNGQVPINSKVGGLHRMVLRRALKEWRSRQQKRVLASYQPPVLSET